jgi:RimJ/RimL family protein N-acetyltransferase
VSKVVTIVQLPAEVVHALAAGDLDAAVAASPVALTPVLIEQAGLWRRRSRQLEVDPSCAGWITGVVRVEPDGLTVGWSGFHGPPDATGAVEVGYAIDPGHRRRGYARAALEFLLARAARERAVRRVRATISPGNVASRNLVLQYGFTEIGEQWDDEDGLEIVFEVSAGDRPA